MRSAKERPDKLALAAKVTLIVVAWAPGYWALGLKHSLVPLFGSLLPGEWFANALFALSGVLFFFWIFSEWNENGMPNGGTARLILFTSGLSSLAVWFLTTIAVP